MYIKIEDKDKDKALVILLLTHIRFDMALVKAKELAVIRKSFPGLRFIVSVNPSKEMREYKPNDIKSVISQLNIYADQVLFTPYGMGAYEHFFYATSNADIRYILITADDDQFDYDQMKIILEKFFSKELIIYSKIVGFNVKAGFKGGQQNEISFNGYCSCNRVDRVESFLKNPNDFIVYFIYDRIFLEEYLFRNLFVNWILVPARLKHRRIAYLMVFEMLFDNVIQFIDDGNPLVTFYLENGSSIEKNNIPFLTIIDVQLIWRMFVSLISTNINKKSYKLWFAFIKFSILRIKHGAFR